jgi:hypothetical protein
MKPSKNHVSESTGSFTLSPAGVAAAAARDAHLNRPVRPVWAAAGAAKKVKSEGQHGPGDKTAA